MPIPRAPSSSTPAPVSWFALDVAEEGPVVTVRDGMVVAIDAEDSTPVLPVDDIPLFGRHNVENVLAAVAMARAAGVPAEPIAAGIRAFRPVAHRLEPVCEANSVLWVDDSKATNVDSAIAALRSFPGRSIVWIGGGGRKGVPCDRLAAEVASRVRFAVLNGESAGELDEALARLGFASRVVVPSLREAVEEAARVARPGDVVLLAPGYTSFDQFGDYEERGRAFARWVRALVGVTSGDADDRSSTVATTSGGTR
jgi:UDP-N-acetylmuramoylalanine--D-glutamate ligase